MKNSPLSVRVRGRIGLVLLLTAAWLSSEPARAAVYFEETFDSYADDAAVLAGGWGILDNSTDAEADWTITNPASRRNPMGSTGKFMVADSDAGTPDASAAGVINEALMTPKINLSAATRVWLHFATFIEPNDTGDTINDVEVSVDDGASWTRVFSAISPNSAVAISGESGDADGRLTPVHVDLSGVAAGQANVRIRFLYLDATDDWFWIVDNVVVDDVPGPAGGAVVIMAEESFEGDFPPANWQLVRSSNAAGNNPWTRDDVGGFRNAGSISGANFINRLGPDHFAILDSDLDPDAAPEDEQLVIPVLDCRGFSNVFLHVKSEMKYNDAETVADIEVSRDGGVSFATLFTYNGSNSTFPTPPGPRDNEVYYDPMVLDASVAAGSSNVVFRFRFRGNGDEWFWAIDDVQVTGTEGEAEPIDPPLITEHPADATTTERYTIAFTVGVSGTPPFLYQWQLNRTDLEGETNATLTLRSVVTNQAGLYRVVVRNEAGTATSNEATLTVNPAPPILVTGQWDFDNGDLSATAGSALDYRGDTQQFTEFTELLINGEPAKVMKFPGTTPAQGYIMRHGAAPNAGGVYVNVYTLIMDVMFPTESDAQWRVILQTSTANSNDGDYFVNPGNGIGISSVYEGTIQANVWHRVGLVVDLTRPTVTKYIDGVLVGTQTLGSGLDGRWSLDPFALLFADNDGDTAAGFVNSIQFRDGIVTAAEMALLGGATAGGIPAASGEIAVTSISLAAGEVSLA